MANRFPLIFNSGAGQIQELAASDNLDLTSSNLVNAGILFTSSGSATAPSLQIGSGTTYNPGLYSPGTDQLAISTNGTQKLIILSDGKTGIGASSPIFLTDILSGTPNTGANVNNPSQLSVTGPNKTLIGGGATFFVNSNSDFAIDNGGSIALSGRNTTSSTNSVVWGVVKGAKENATSTHTAGYLAFASSNHATGALVEAMRIDSQQRVSLGTSSPNTQLTVYTVNPGGPLVTIGGANSLGGVTGIRMGYGEGSAYTKSAILFENTDGAYAKGTLHFCLDNVNDAGNASLSDSKVSITSAGLVGIGTTGPNAPLHVSADSETQLILNRATTTTGASFLKFTNLGGNYYIGPDSSTGNRAFSIGGAPYGLSLAAESAYPIVFGTNNIERARIDISGRLLVGTTTARSNFFNTSSVSGMLQIEGTDNLTRAFSQIHNTNSSAGSMHVLAKSRGTTAGSNVIVQSGDVLGEVGFQGSDGTEFVEGASIQAFVDGTPGANDMPGRLVFNTTADGASSPTERMRITSAGLVGIGTTSPQKKLVASNGGAEGIEFSPGDSANKNVVINYNRSTSAYITVQNLADVHIWGGYGNSGSNEAMRTDSSGRLLVGTSSGTKHTIQMASASDFAFQVANTSASTPYVQVLTFTAAAPNDATSMFLRCDDTGQTGRIQLRSNGGIANFSGNNVNLSDVNTKKDIAPAADTWNCLKEWEIVNFRYKDQPDDADLNLGVIAQQVAESCPEVITVFQEAKEATEDQPAKEERLGVKDQQMMWMAIKALQEAQLRIEALEAEVAALKAS